jgi:5'-nucleotidase
VQELATYVTPHTIKQVGSLKVGFFGLTTPETNLLSLPAPVIVDTSIVPIAMAEIATLRAQGCDVVILLSHLGRSIDEKLSAYLTGIDLIIGAHSHETITEEGPAGSNIPIVQGAPFYHGIGVAQLLVDGDNVSLLGNMVVPMDASIPEATEVRTAVDLMIADIESVYGPVYTTAIAEATEEIEELAEDLDVQGDHDTPLGNLTTDAFRAWGGTEIAIEPGGSVAQPLYEGPLVTADAFRAISYGFNMKNGLGYRMARFSVLGAEIIAGLEFGIMDLGSDEFMSQVSGMSYSYDPNRPPTQRLVDVKVGETSMDPMRRYTVTANEFVVLFFSVLGITPQNVEVNEDTTESMVLAGYLQALQTVSPEISGRVRATSTTGVHEQATSDLHLFDVVSQDGQARVDLTCGYTENVTVDLYTVNLRHIQVPTEIIRTDEGVHVTATTAALESGMYIMRVKIGDCVNAGRVVVTK